MIHPVRVNLASVYDLGVLIGISILIYLFSLSSKTLKRWEGIVMVLLYVAYVVFAAVR